MTHMEQECKDVMHAAYKAGDSRETIETEQWSDRELQLRTYYQAVETNGTVHLHSRDLYGDVLGHTGLQQRVTLLEESHLELVKLQGSVNTFHKLAWVWGGAMLTGMFSVLALLLEHIL